MQVGGAGYYRFAGDSQGRQLAWVGKAYRQEGAGVRAAWDCGGRRVIAAAHEGTIEGR